MHPHPQIPPKCRPIQPKQPVSSIFHPMGLQFGGHTPRLAAPQPPNGGMTPSKAPTRRRHAVRGLRMAQNPHRHRCVGRRRDQRTRPRRRRAAAGPGCGTRGRRQGLAGHRDNAPSDAPATQAPPVWRAPEGPEGTGGLRDRPLRAFRLACGFSSGRPGPTAPGTPAAPQATTRSMCGSRAGRRPRGHQAARPHKAHAAPGTSSGPQASTSENKNRRSRRICGFIVREGGVEPPLHHWNTDLNRARLPIPPLARTQKE